LAGGPPAISRWEILADHGTENVRTDVSGSTEYTESRIEAVRKLAVYFSRPAKSETVTAAALTIVGRDLLGNPVDLSDLSWTTELSFDQRVATITFSRPLADRVRYCLTLGNVVDPFNNAFMAGKRVVFTVLEGDAFMDRRTNNSDVGAVRSLEGVVFDRQNALHVRADINRDGLLNQVDTGIAIARRGVDTRAIVSPCESLIIGPSGQPGLVVSIAESATHSGSVPDALVEEPESNPHEPDPADPAVRFKSPAVVDRDGSPAWGELAFGETVPDDALASMSRVVGLHAIYYATDVQELENAASGLGLKLARGGSSGWWFVWTEDALQLKKLIGALHTDKMSYSSVWRSSDSDWILIERRMRVDESVEAEVRLIASSLINDVSRISPIRSDPCCVFELSAGSTDSLLQMAQSLRKPGTTSPAVELRVFVRETVRADLNRDGVVSVLDVDECARLLQSLDPRADVNEDGAVTGQDVVTVLKSVVP
ncbi:MAG TPA: dockerin type I domain-containing protein, partial [Phycisphaerales bacterium]|nr:dockerin type I domain-containing protein [Phycisphaerales bacterium]